MYWFQLYSQGQGKFTPNILWCFQLFEIASIFHQSVVLQAQLDEFLWLFLILPYFLNISSYWYIMNLSQWLCMYGGKITFYIQMLGDELSSQIAVIHCFPFNRLFILQLYSWIMVKWVHNVNIFPLIICTYSF